MEVFHKIQIFQNKFLEVCFSDNLLLNNYCYLFNIYS